MYVKFSPNQYVLRFTKGRLTAEGKGLSFFYLDRMTSAAAVPVSNTDADLIFEETTADFQKLTVQGQLTYRITDYKKAASAVDFTVNLKTKDYSGNPIAKLSKRIINISEVAVRGLIGGMELTEALSAGEGLAADVLERLCGDAEIAELGAQVIGFSVMKIAANPETARALEAATREEILKQSDDALYERRNASIDQERRVKENELSTEISVQEKKKKIRETEIQTRMMVQAREAEMERIRLDNEIELEKKRRELADLKLENAKKEADADSYRIGAVMEAYGRLGSEVLIALAQLNMEPEKLIAQAFEKLAANSGNIGTLNITPDLLESLTGKRGA